MRKYMLDSVYKAAALDEIYRCLSDERDLTKEDLDDCTETLFDLHNPDLTFSDCDRLADNLNIVPAQLHLSERIEVLRFKMQLLSDILEYLRLFPVIDGTVEMDDCPF